MLLTRDIRCGYRCGRRRGCGRRHRCRCGTRCGCGRCARRQSRCRCRCGRRCGCGCGRSAAGDTVSIAAVVQPADIAARSSICGGYTNSECINRSAAAPFAASVGIGAMTAGMYRTDQLTSAEAQSVVGIGAAIIIPQNKGNGRAYGAADVIAAAEGDHLIVGISPDVQLQGCRIPRRKGHDALIWVGSSFIDCHRLLRQQAVLGVGMLGEGADIRSTNGKERCVCADEHSHANHDRNQFFQFFVHTLTPFCVLASSISLL